MPFALALREQNYRILASGGTAKALKAAGVPAQDVASLVGGRDILGHKVVTLSRELHAGLLADYVTEVQEMADLNLAYVDLVCVDLYPLEAEIAREGATRDSVIKLTDVGGPTMLHSGSKGRRIVICDPADRMLVIEWLKAGKPDEDQFLTDLVAKAENVVGRYITTSSIYHGAGRYAAVFGERVVKCCYGENKDQESALFSTGNGDPLALDQFVKAESGMMNPSHINYCDMDSALTTLCHATDAFRRESYFPCIAIAVKHGNACGAGYGDTPIAALKKMIEGDRTAILGASVMTNFPIGEEEAEILLHWKNLPGEKRRLIDCLDVPSITTGAIKLMERRSGKCRVMVNPALASRVAVTMETGDQIRKVRGGFLKQSAMKLTENPLSDPAYLICGKRPARRVLLDGLFAWAVTSTSVSNTVVLVKDGRLIGNGCGRQSRVDACRLAVQLAQQNGHNITGAVAWSDSFFPKLDGPKMLVEAGVRTIFTTSGSTSDDEIFDYFRQQPWLTVIAIPDKINRAFCRH